MNEDRSRRGQEARDRRARLQAVEPQEAAPQQPLERPIQAHLVALQLARSGMAAGDVEIAQRLIAHGTRERLGHAIVFAGPDKRARLAVDVDVTRATLQRLHRAGFSARTLSSLVDEVERANTRE